MNALTVLASAAFGSTVYLTALSTVGQLNQRASYVKVAGLIATGIVLCAVIGIITFASQSVVLGFILGAVLTPPVHRRILRRRAHAAGS
ncbi:hypothetical protein [Streptomyces virginiae]|uniref:hypothetical protein n=1 Tax=Streptomyces virginiae TaxID=1961 RepID=UPI0022557AE1|nr:hypothetical protein [Streptomyces virginiae]MCX5277580.1 hypothetical protein [Streptomyces virginiae]